MPAVKDPIVFCACDSCKRRRVQKSTDARKRIIARAATAAKTHGAELFGDLPEGQP